MTRTTTLGVLALALVLVTSGAAGVAGATPASTADEATAATSSVPLAQETTEENETDGNATEDGTETGNETEMGNESETGNETSEQPEVDSNASASVTFDDQPSDGSSVVVNETNLSDGGFVVALDSAGAFVGNSSYLEPGTHENVTVELNTTLDSSGVVVVVPHQDTNDNQAFDYNATLAEEVGAPNATDGPYLENGTPGGTTAYVTVGNDTTDRSMDVPKVDP